MDTFTKEKRSQIMSAIKGKDTKPEVMLRKALFKQGFRYNINNKKICGKPDIYLKKYNAVILFHGCFWHGHTCKAGSLPKTNTKFWRDKIQSNQARDKKVITNLRNTGYRILIIWGCALKGKGISHFKYVVNKSIDWLKSDNRFNEISNDFFE